MTDEAEDQVPKLVFIPFHEDVIETFRDAQGIWVDIENCCKSVKLDYSTQLCRLKPKVWATWCVVPTRKEFYPRERLYFHVNTFSMWLATIESNRPETGLRDKIERYQKEAPGVVLKHYLSLNLLPEQDPVMAILEATKAMRLDQIAQANINAEQVKVNAEQAKANEKVETDVKRIKTIWRKFWSAMGKSI